MSSALQGQLLPGQQLQGRREADRALAARDTRIPALNWMLDDELLSDLLGEQVRITRTRYKPGTSVLVSFRRGEGDGARTFGWASTTAVEYAGKLHRRAATSQSHGGGIRLVQPDRFDPDAVVAVGGIAEDWPLRANLRWLRKYGFERLGIPATAQLLLDSQNSVLRYNPGRRLVVRVPAGAGSVVVKTAAHSDEEATGLRLRELMAGHGVPVLPELADSECALHGVSASPSWGDGDLSGRNDTTAAFLAGEALAVLHRIPSEPDADPEKDAGNMVLQVAATRSMVDRLLPELQPQVDGLANRLLGKTCSPRGRHGVPVHGDFSADQVLVNGAAIRIIDFDAARMADPAMDLGSFAAVEESTEVGGAVGNSMTGARTPAVGNSMTGARTPAGGPKTAGLIDGYCQAGGRVSPSEVETWAAFRLFLDSVDPFRNRASDWPARTQWHVSRALELIA